MYPGGVELICAQGQLLRAQQVLLPSPRDLEAQVERGEKLFRRALGHVLDLTGRARAVRTLDEAEQRLAPGEILVTPATLPSWTPFFAFLAGVVTGAGGVLSHAAVVAREYGFPAVVSVRGSWT